MQQQFPYPYNSQSSPTLQPQVIQQQGGDLRQGGDSRQGGDLSQQYSYFQMALDDVNQDSKHGINSSSQYSSSRRDRDPNAPPKQFNIKVFVGNLSYETTWQALKNHMSQISEVQYADIFKDQNGRSKGCGFVEYKTQEEAQKNIQQLNNSKLDGREIYVREDRIEEARIRGKKYEPRYLKESSFGRSRSRSRSRSRNRSRSRDRNINSYSSSDRFSQGGADIQQGFTVVIKDLPRHMTWRTLKEFFKNFGSVKQADINMVKGKPIGVVTFNNKRDAIQARNKMDRAYLDGDKISVATTF